MIYATPAAHGLRDDVLHVTARGTSPRSSEVTCAWSPTRPMSLHQTSEVDSCGFECPSAHVHAGRTKFWKFKSTSDRSQSKSSPRGNVTMFELERHTQPARVCIAMAFCNTTASIVGRQGHLTLEVPIHTHSSWEVRRQRSNIVGSPIT